jgi:glycosyltransferase involved in cell wall biosynthesis
MIRLADLLNPFRSLHRAVTTWREQHLTARVKRAKRAARAFPYDEHPRLSLIVQSFNHVRNVDQIMRGLRQAEVDEIIICEDGSIDGSRERWAKHLKRRNDFVLLSNDLHEIRASDRAISLSRGEFICMIQDDDLLPPDGRWIQRALALFDAYPSLGCLGGFMGFRQYTWMHECFQNFEDGHEASPVCDNPIPTIDPHTGFPFMFIESVNIGPYFLRRSAFEAVGGWDFSYSEAGNPGMGYDHELGFRMWSSGFKTGLYYAPLYDSTFNELARKGGTYLWGREDRERAAETFPERLRQRYQGVYAQIRQRVDESNALLIPSSASYLEWPARYRT